LPTRFHLLKALTHIYVYARILGVTRWIFTGTENITTRINTEQYRQCTYNVTLRRLLATIVAVEKI